jgi:integrase
MTFEPPRLPPVSGNVRRVIRRRGAVWVRQVPDARSDAAWAGAPGREDARAGVAGQGAAAARLLQPPQRVEAWKIRWLAEQDARRQGAKLLAILHGVMERAREAYDLPRNPVADADRIRISYDAARFDFYSPEEVYALARAAASERDAALFLTAAFAGLRRGELVALRWRDVDFEKRSIRVEGSFSHGAVTTTKGGPARAVPLVAEVAQSRAAHIPRGFGCCAPAVWALRVAATRSPRAAAAGTTTSVR